MQVTEQVIPDEQVLEEEIPEQVLEEPSEEFLEGVDSATNTQENTQGIEPPEKKGYLDQTGQVTIEDVKVALPEQDYHTLTIGQEQNGIHCLTIAKLRVKGDVQSTGNVYDESLPEIRLALLKMFIYELFAFVGETEKAEATYQDYTLIIKTSFGDIKTKNDTLEDTGPAVASVQSPKKWSRYGC